MKHITLFLVLTCCSLQAPAQAVESDQALNESAIWNQLSFTLKTGTPSVAISNLNDAGRDLLNIGISEIGSAFKINQRLSIGVSLMGGLGNCIEGYFDAEGNLIEIEDDHEDGEEEGDDDEGELEACESEVESLMATLSYLLFEELPIFVQGSVGYNLDEHAPAYSLFVGYNKALFSNISVTGGLRFSEVLIKIPSDLDYSRSGFKAEIGINWNF